MDNAIIPDQSDRTHALDPSRSFIVQAPAGSGKTELLVRRYVRLLGAVERPEEILAITFTKKAAAEMRKRVLASLPDAAQISPRLRIMTIDALCAALTRQMPILARFGAQPAMAEQDEARELYRDAARRTLALLESGGDVADHAAKLLAHLDNNVEEAARLLAAMLARRDQWLRKAGNPPTREELEAAFAAERERLVARAQALHPSPPAPLPQGERGANPQRPVPVAPGERGANQKQVPLPPGGGGDRGEGDARHWEELAKSVLTKEGTWRKKPKPAPPELVGNEPLREALFALMRMPPARYSDDQWQALEAILNLLKLAAAELKLVFGERGLADFTEIAQGAVRALGTVDEPTDLLLSLDARIRHILVDEFQDTSISQWELLERLTAGWDAGDGRTVFAVGDPMQSIYRFREAEVALFLHARRAGLGSVRFEPLTLKTNFRSQAGIVEWVNATFAGVLPAVEDESLGAVPYSAAAPHPDNIKLAGEAASWHACATHEDEARRAVELVRAARAADPAATCAMLVRNRNALTDIVPALKAAGIRFRAIEIEKLDEKQVVQDLYALTRALTHPADRIAWLALLRAPWCGLTLQDLSTLLEPETPLSLDGRGAGGEGEISDNYEHSFNETGYHRDSQANSNVKSGNITIWELLHDEPRLARLPTEARTRLTRLRNILAHAQANHLRDTLRSRVEGAWLALGGPACLTDRTDLEDAEIFLDQLEKLEQAGDIDPAALEQSLNDLYALPDLEAGETDLQIMTVHKAKGLEFDTVIVPGLDRSPRSGERPLFVWKSQPDGGLLLAPINPTGDPKEPLYRYVRDLQKQAEDTEAARLLYVAATRAKKRLHLLACVKQDEENQIKPPAKRSLLGRAWQVAATALPPLAIPTPHVDERGAAVPPLPPGGGGAGGEGDPQLSRQSIQAQPPLSLDGRGAGGEGDVIQRVPATFTSPTPPAPVHWQASEESRNQPSIEFSWAGETARHIGTITHRYLQRIAEDQLQGWTPERIDTLHPRIKTELERRGTQPSESTQAATRIATALKQTLADERGRWLLGPHAEAHSEYRLRTRSQGVLRSHVIDRLVRDGQGGCWIVDYKTGGHEGADIEAFLDSERERYAPQLERYAAAIGGGRLGLYFPLLKGWREWG